MSSGNVNMLLQWLVTLGVPGAVIAAIGSLYRAHQKRKAIIAAAPDNKIDQSLERAQQAAILTDKIIDNLREDNDQLREENAALRQQLEAARNTPPRTET